MPERNTDPDVTIRGGMVYVPHSTKPRFPVRHQPNTPPRKPKTAPKVVKEPDPSPTAPPVVEPEPATEPVSEV